ncbi:MAG: HisA/HisF-related TIM barrel protein [Flavobacteriales bacterium]|nr:HisA/HisF-related TIM barrel protein [Flavobacteriales bacterium]
MQRLIPILLIENGRLVKTVRFRRPSYVGDPLNTLRIFNRLEVDEICFVDIGAARRRYPPPLSLIRELSAQAFMPISYGGGIASLDVAQTIVEYGVEKLIVGTNAFDSPTFVERLAGKIGSQSVVCAMDVKRNLWGRWTVYVQGAQRQTRLEVRDAIRWVQSAGAGEIILTDIQREGTWLGLNRDLLEYVLPVVTVPLVLHGGAHSGADVEAILAYPGVSGVAIGSLAVYQKKGGGVLIGYPTVQRTMVTFANPRP